MTVMERIISVIRKFCGKNVYCAFCRARRGDSENMSPSSQNCLWTLYRPRKGWKCVDQNLIFENSFSTFAWVLQRPQAVLRPRTHIFGISSASPTKCRIHVSSEKFNNDWNYFRKFISAKFQNHSHIIIIY